ncbi:hypothetical protein HYU09_05025 [Candidatus Woesearchaeota archaeon]|nr:hypothetical protein [Candidatus Woesearchaeota archaeon]
MRFGKNALISALAGISGMTAVGITTLAQDAKTLDDKCNGTVSISSFAGGVGDAAMHFILNQSGLTTTEVAKDAGVNDDITLIADKYMDVKLGPKSPKVVQLGFIPDKDGKVFSSGQVAMGVRVPKDTKLKWVAYDRAPDANGVSKAIDIVLPSSNDQLLLYLNQISPAYAAKVLARFGGNIKDCNLNLERPLVNDFIGSKYKDRIEADRKAQIELAKSGVLPGTYGQTVASQDALTRLSKLVTEGVGTSMYAEAVKQHNIKFVSAPDYQAERAKSGDKSPVELAAGPRKGDDVTAPGFSIGFNYTYRGEQRNLNVNEPDNYQIRFIRTPEQLKATIGDNEFKHVVDKTQSERRLYPAGSNNTWNGPLMHVMLASEGSRLAHQLFADGNLEVSYKGLVVSPHNDLSNLNKFFEPSYRTLGSITFQRIDPVRKN